MTPECMALLARVIRLVGNGVRLIAHEVNGDPDCVDWSVEYVRIYRIPHAPVILTPDSVYSRTLEAALLAVIAREEERDRQQVRHLLQRRAVQEEETK